MLFMGLDDTDTLESRGTGHLARQIASALATDYQLQGVTRHQLLLDPRVPCTKNNSCAAVVLDVDGGCDPHALARHVGGLMLSDFQPGSAPGLCLALAPPTAVTGFGRRAQRELVSRDEAYWLAADHDLLLYGLGGSQDGVIGALAAVALAASGRRRRSRELSGLQPVSALLAAGIAAVETLDGDPVTHGLVQTDRLRPSRRSGRPVAVVEWAGDHWLPIRLD